MITIRKYQNRKLYHLTQSRYISLDDLVAMVRAGEEFRVVDHRTKNDITADTLIHAVYERERRMISNASVDVLRAVISRGHGFCSYLDAMQNITQKEAHESIN